ncbi:cytochrome c oxidase subunit 5a [Sporothrix schenckii 1099-18]|uniref:Cytochrome c oxidase subunit 6, mitochondrial n=1 Tax=Sporothrix schenckii 1099-18 TaxID=1397361 RepID=A0A0F2LUH4_SPOSC|nr:cytochrome c oxidase subunit 5a [Sporothrix schenckii 1099-18]KJR81128.1 cytochrome c oxidase subunit 5a [Sporothrix schenckii 1099-18]
MSASIFRAAARGFRAPLVARPAAMTTRTAFVQKAAFSAGARLRSEHQEETFEEFTARQLRGRAAQLRLDVSACSIYYPDGFLGQLSRKLKLTSNVWSRYEKEFDSVQDVFELQRNLNNAFAYDLVPSPSVLIAALKAARRVNDYPTAVRVFEGIKAKVENKGQYQQYLEELKPLKEELGIVLKEELYPEESA